MNNEEIKVVDEKYKGVFNKWTGALSRTAGLSRIDIWYAIMRLPGYNTAPTYPYVHALNHMMCYIYDHPHITIMYTRNNSI